MLNTRILDRYIIYKYIVTFFTMLFLFIPISVLVDLSQKIDNFNQKEVPTLDIFWYYYNFVWHFGFILFPIFLFLSVIWFTSKLSSNSEDSHTRVRDFVLQISTSIFGCCLNHFYWRICSRAIYRTKRQ